MAHRSRSAWVDELRSILGPVPVAMDEREDASREGMLANCVAAWKLHDPACDYHLVLQDDVVLCENFKAKVNQFLERFTAPGTEPAAVSFYFSNGRSYRALAEDGKARGWVWSKIRWGPALCLPTAWIGSMLVDFESQTIPHDDTRIGVWLSRHKRRAYHSIPSLVDHRGDESLIGNRSGRAAAVFVP